MRCLSSVVLLLLLTAHAPAAEFTLTFDKAALDRPFTGRVYVMLLRAEPRTVPNGLNWFSPEPTFAKDVKNWKPGAELTLDATAISVTPMAEVKAGKYFAQAVLDRDLGGISFAASPGNVYSKPLTIDFDPKAIKAVAMTLDQVGHAVGLSGEDATLLSASRPSIQRYQPRFSCAWPTYGLLVNPVISRSKLPSAAASRLVSGVARYCLRYNSPSVSSARSAAGEFENCWTNVSSSKFPMRAKRDCRPTSSQTHRPLRRRGRRS